MAEMIGTATVVDSKRPPLVDVAAVARQASPGRWVVTIHGWIPVSDNRLLTTHHMKAHRLKAADKAVVAAEMFQAGVPKATGKRRVGVLVLCPNMSRAPDSGNVNKSLRDALVACGALLNDDAAGAVFTEPVVEKGKKATVITIEDVT